MLRREKEKLSEEWSVSLSAFRPDTFPMHSRISNLRTVFLKMWPLAICIGIT